MTRKKSENQEARGFEVEFRTLWNELQGNILRRKNLKINTKNIESLSSVKDACHNYIAGNIDKKTFLDGAKGMSWPDIAIVDKFKEKFLQQKAEEPVPPKLPRWVKQDAENFVTVTFHDKASFKEALDTLVNSTKNASNIKTGKDQTYFPKINSFLLEVEKSGMTLSIKSTTSAGIPKTLELIEKLQTIADKTLSKPPPKAGRH